MDLTATELAEARAACNEMSYAMDRLTKRILEVGDGPTILRLKQYGDALIHALDLTQPSVSR